MNTLHALASHWELRYCLKLMDFVKQSQRHLPNFEHRPDARLSRGSVRDDALHDPKPRKSSESIVQHVHKSCNTHRNERPGPSPPVIEALKRSVRMDLLDAHI